MHSSLFVKMISRSDIVFLLLLLTTLCQYMSNADRVKLHEHPEVAIVDYSGPLHKNVLKLLKKAEILEVRNSNITSMHGHFLSELPKLKKIEFINCTVDSDKVDVETLLKGATNLKEFHASFITAKQLKPQILRETPVEIFTMTDNTYPHLPAHLLNGSNLQFLDLARNQMETIDDNAFHGLHRLKRLTLDSNKLKTLNEPVLEPLESLELLELRENQLEKLDFNDLPDLPNLTKIDIAHNPLKELKLDGIESKAPELQTIDITGTPLVNQIDGLKSKYPNIFFKTSD